MNPATPSKNHRQQILVIDDEEVVRLLFDSLLSEEGYHPLLADCAQGGIAILEERHPPLVLVDKNLPDMSGVDLISDQKKRHPEIEFIMITGYASLDSAIKAMEVGAFSYLTKPFSDMGMVMERIRAALEVTSLRQETSLLRSRLSTLPPQPPAGAPKPATSAAEALSRQVEHTVALLGALQGKRAQVPTAVQWARLLDMLEEERRRLALLIEPQP